MHNHKLWALLAIPALLVGCNKPTNKTAVSLPTPQLTACPDDPNDTGEEDSYSPLDQATLVAQLSSGKAAQAYFKSFRHGDMLFGTHFTLEQGGGAYIGGSENSHYTRIPRADLTQPNEWGDPKRLKPRPTGPNAQSCGDCHSQPTEDGAGPTSANVHRDHMLSGNPEQIIQRNTPHLFGAGALQRLAEEMTVELHDIKQKAGEQACADQGIITKKMHAKGIDFGSVTMLCKNGVGYEDTAQSQPQGISADWVVRPYEWKKIVAFLRDFMRDAGNNEIGMQSVELVRKDNDEDHDGKTNELTVGDLTAFTVYMAAQVRPTTHTELDDIGILSGTQRLTTAQRQQIKHGEQLFQQTGCSSCHLPELTLNNSIFQEPSLYDDYRDKKADFLKTGKVQVDLEAEGVKPSLPVKFDLAHDQVQNQLCKGKQKIHLGAFESKAGKTSIKLYGDLKQHWMGDKLAEAIDETKATRDYDGNHNMALNVYQPNDHEKNRMHPFHGQATFGTKELWGVACTGPWLHDGRATTLTEAITLHGGEAADSSTRFSSLPDRDKKDLIAFLGNQVLYLNGAKHGEKPDPLSAQCEVSE